MRALGRGSVGPRVLVQGAFQFHRGLEGSAPSPALNEWRCPNRLTWQPGCRVNLALELGRPHPQHCGARPLGKGPSGADIGSGLGPRRPTGPSQGLSSEWWGGPKVRALGGGTWAQGIYRTGPLNVTPGSVFPARSPILNDRWCPDVPGWRAGSRVSLALGLGGTKSPVFRGQDPWEGPSRWLWASRGVGQG